MTLGDIFMLVLGMAVLYGLSLEFKAAINHFRKNNKRKKR
jgi:hypothetical protein